MASPTAPAEGAPVERTPSGAPAPPPARPRVMLIGTGLAATGCIMAFAGLIGVYLTQRASVLSAGEEWLPSGSIPLVPSNMALFTLLLSVVTMQWAVYASRNEDRQNTWVALGLTLVLGAAFINATSFIYTQMDLGAAESVAALLIFVITGAHLAMVGGAMLFALLAGFRSFGESRVGRSHEAVASAALLWDVAVAIFAVIWYAIYITK